MTGSQREAINIMMMMESVTVNADLVAQALGISESTVGTRLMRARNKLAISLRGWYFEEE